MIEGFPSVFSVSLWQIDDRSPRDTEGTERGNNETEEPGQPPFQTRRA